MSASTSTNNVLSDKVNRALHVRTDTPAMRAALDALANLPSDDHPPSLDTTTSTTTTTATTPSAVTGTIDARSVRMAIERDALRRALQFQDELKRLARDATVLRERVDVVAKVAQMVGSRVETPVVSSAIGGRASSSSMLMMMGGGLDNGDTNPYGGSMGTLGDVSDAATGAFNNHDNHSNHLHKSTHLSPEAAWEEERNLAARLHAAHKSLSEASHRQIAVDAFLDKFDLGEGEARLLDHYNFEGFIEGHHRHHHHHHMGGEDQAQQSSLSSSPWNHPNAALQVIGQPPQNAMEDATAFLNALERLVIIRAELSKTFGGGDASTHSSSRNAHTNDADDDETDIRMGGQLGTHSALRMMEQLASRQQRAHERLYQFVQFFLGIGNAATSIQPHHVPTSSSDVGRSSVSASDVALYGALGRFRDGDEMDEAFSHPIMRRALHVLRHSPAHQCHALELIASSRRTEVTRRFLLALTSGYDGAAPMEMRAHDPVAYVGDMLAFTFRAFRVEGELVKTLMVWKENDSDDEDESAVNTSDETKAMNAKRSTDASSEEKHMDGDDDERDEVPMDLFEILAQSMGGLARPLRSRISQVVKSLASQGDSSGHGNNMATHSGILDGGNHSDDDETSSTLNRLVAVFSVCGLLKFYGSAVRMALNKLQSSQGNQNQEYYYEDARNPFLVTCDECLSEASGSYVASLRAFGAMLGTHSGPMEGEAQLAQRVIVRISEERIASPGFSEDASTVDVSSADDLVSKELSLSFLVGTMIDAAMPYLRGLDDCTALKSALTVAVKCGLETSESAKWNGQVEEKEQMLVETLVDTETDKVIEVCGLSGMRSAMRQMNGVYVEGMTMATHPGLSQSIVEAAMKQFYSSLFAPPIPSFEEAIRDPELRNRARSMTAQRVVDIYRELYGAIISEKGGYEDLAFLGHDPDQVKTLLSL